MLNPTKLKTFSHAYRTRMNRGESVESIDELYLSLKRLSEEDIVQIHQFMKIRTKPKVEVKEGGRDNVSDKS